MRAAGQAVSGGCLRKPSTVRGRFALRTALASPKSATRSARPTSDGGGAEPRRVPATGGIIQLGGSSTQMKRCPYKNVDPGPGPQDRPSAPGSAQTDGRGRAATASVL